MSKTKEIQAKISYHNPDKDFEVLLPLIGFRHNTVQEITSKTNF